MCFGILCLFEAIWRRSRAHTYLHTRWNERPFCDCVRVCHHLRRRSLHTCHNTTHSYRLLLVTTTTKERVSFHSVDSFSYCSVRHRCSRVPYLLYSQRCQIVSTLWSNTQIEKENSQKAVVKKNQRYKKESCEFWLPKYNANLFRLVKVHILEIIRSYIKYFFVECNRKLRF